MADLDNSQSRLEQLVPPPILSISADAKTIYSLTQAKKEEVILDSLSNPKFNILMFLHAK